jgi:endoglucanase
MRRTLRFATACIESTAFAWLVAIAMSPTAARAQAPTVRAEGAPPIRLNSIGYLPTAAKQATVAAGSKEFAVVRTSDGATVYSGTLSGPSRNDDTDESLCVADFSALVEPGEYRLEVAGVGESAPFRVDADVYRQPYYMVMRGMYLSRCGAAVRGEHAGHVFEHAACHLDDASFDLLADDGSPREERQRVATGGWHDAGDYNKYVVNAGVTVGCLLRAWQDFHPQLERIELDIPESAGSLPDFLAEVKWELDWLLTMQADDGSVYHKVSTPHYGGFVSPEDERTPRYFGEPGSQATASFVAMMASAARHFRPYDPQYADRCLAAAQKGYAYLTAHPEYVRPSQDGFSTVGYDSGDWAARLWAAAEIWETTGDAAALADFESRAKSPEPARRRWRGNQADDNDDGPTSARSQYEVDENWDWGNPKNLGLIVYLESSRPGRDAALVAKVRASLLATAERIVATANSHGYARPLGSRYFWGCNGTVARQVVVLEAARRAEANPAYRNAALDALNHLFGRNVYGRSYVTGLGDRPPLHPHDRRSGADNVDEPWPGYLVGGPNPSALDWHDEQDDYRTNEIAINWNGALIYALAAFQQSPSAPRNALP